MARITSLTARGVFQLRLNSGLVSQAVIFSCFNCSHDIRSDMPWRCDYCSFDNNHVELFAFLYKCQRCNHAPRSCLCPHCDKINFLDRNSDSGHPASKIKSTPTIELDTPPKDPKELAGEVHEEKMRALARKIKEETLKANLRQIRRPPAEEQKPETFMEREVKRLRGKVDSFLGTKAAADIVRAEFMEKLKDQPDKSASVDEALTKSLEDDSISGSNER